MEKDTCSTCGAKVRIEGHTTKYYVPEKIQDDPDEPRPKEPAHKKEPKPRSRWYRKANR